MSSEKKPKPSITPTPDGPYLVKDLENFANQKGAVETKPKMALCRCGGSDNKPFCDTRKERFLIRQTGRPR